MADLSKIGFGGGCHWCTEAVFSFLKGVNKVEQGWISSNPPDESFSEAVVVHFNEEVISINDLVSIHLHTHQCTSDHSMRAKYRSAIYYFDEHQKSLIPKILKQQQSDFEDAIVTKSLPFKAFRPSPPRYQNYYQKDPEKPFCQTYIKPKLSKLLSEFKNNTDEKSVRNSEV